MRIVATCRARDNEAIIERFCMAYQDIADLILVADGGSTDRTVEIAQAMPKTKVLHFEERIQVGGGLWINPQGAHMNFLIDHARDEGADWIIFDDSDCVPNFLLCWQARMRFEWADYEGHQAVFARRVYFWGEDQIFPKMHEPNTSIWAWQRNAPIRGGMTDQWHLHVEGAHDIREKSAHLEFPYCLLHYSWPSEEAAAAKIAWYHQTGVQPTAQHPLDFAGPLEGAEWFMREKPPITRSKLSGLHTETKS